MTPVPAKKGIALILLLCISCILHAQFHAQRKGPLRANSRWYFGVSGLNFNQDPPAEFLTIKYYHMLRSQHNEDSTFEYKAIGLKYPNQVVVSDTQSGDLRFLVTRHAVYDRNIDLVPNGRFDTDTFDYSLLKSNVVAPVLNDHDKYYCFNLSVYGEVGLTYSIMDMKLNNGLGDIVVSGKNTVLKAADFFDPVPEIIEAVPGDNCDYWLLLAENSTSINSFRISAFNVTTAGINPNPVVSILPKDDAAQSLSDYQVAPGRELLSVLMLKDQASLQVRPSCKLVFFKFDPENGTVSQSTLPQVDVPVVESGLDIHGSFTPDNSHYVVYNNAFQNDTVIFTSYDLSAPGTGYNPAEIKYRLPYWRLSKQMKGTIYVPPTIQFRPYNGKLFFNVPYSFRVPALEPGQYNGYAHSIIKLASFEPSGNPGWNRPEPGISFFFPVYSLYFGSNDVVYPYTHMDTLPNIYLDSAFCYDPLVPFPEFTVKAKAGYSNYVWEDGTTGEEKTIKQPGKHWVYYSGPCNSRVDTFIFRFRESKQVLDPDTVVCAQRFPVAIKANETGEYLWEDLSRERVRRIEQPGTYSITFNAYGCKQFDTIHVSSMYCPCNVSLPNAFSPNSDGLNDYFKPLIAPGCMPAQYSLRIFNRLGQLVYNSFNEYDAGWDGSYSNTPADAGTYFYELRFKSQFLENDYYNKGTLALIR